MMISFYDLSVAAATHTKVQSKLKPRTAGERDARKRGNIL
jgi:hypothetical protein